MAAQIRTRKALTAAIFLSALCCGSCLQAAPSCEQFKAAIVEGAKLYQSPAPQFQLTRVIDVDADTTFWSIAAFDDVRSMMECRHGQVGTFAADANDSETTSSLHLALMMSMGLHGYGLEWPPALHLRDKLIRAAKASESRTAELPVDDTSQASLVISIVGVPSFQIDGGK